MGDLSGRGQLAWVRRPGTSDQFAIVLSGYAPGQLEEVRELLRLLGDSRSADSGRVVLDVSLAVGEPSPGNLIITTRSVHDLAIMLAAATEVAADDERSGRVATFPALGPSGAGLRIRYADSAPKDASVAVQHRSHWYYVADTDLATRLVFYTVQGSGRR